MVLIITFLISAISLNALQREKSIISEKLFNQAKCWNNGDIDCFMRDYWNNDSLMYIGKNGVTYGWQNTLENYKKKYPTKDHMGKLSFEIVRLDQLDDRHYFMVGRWHLERPIGDINGHFSLVWKKIGKDWVIISDHSS
jgi:hypothetical protein